MKDRTLMTDGKMTRRSRLGVLEKKRMRKTFLNFISLNLDNIIKLINYIFSLVDKMVEWAKIERYSET